jgi:hypothetical protein
MFSRLCYSLFQTLLTEFCIHFLLHSLHIYHTYIGGRLSWVTEEIMNQFLKLPSHRTLLLSFRNVYSVFSLIVFTGSRFAFFSSGCRECPSATQSSYQNIVFFSSLWILNIGKNSVYEGKSAVYSLKLNKTSITYLWNNAKSAERGNKGRNAVIIL